MPPYKCTDWPPFQGGAHFALVFVLGLAQHLAVWTFRDTDPTIAVLPTCNPQGSVLLASAACGFRTCGSLMEPLATRSIIKHS